MATNRKLLRHAVEIPALCPYKGFTPDLRSGQVSATVPIPECGKATLSGPFYQWKRRPSSRSDEGIVTRSYFCRTCNRKWEDDYLADRKQDAVLLSNLGLELKR